MVEFTFEQLNYSVTTSLGGKPAGTLDKLRGNTGSKDLIIDVKASVSSGHVLAILGPSGAGKTTLLNMLTLEKKGGVPSGIILVDGKPFTSEMYNRSCAFVQQFDSLWSSLSAREHLGYTLDLFQPNLDKAAHEEMIDGLIAAVGLQDVQHVKAGNEFIRGLSGGNKRRLSIAIALAKKPSILFLDEPTSGVDSASAVMMMSFLKKVAMENNIAVLCTIHQPPASVYSGFDQVLILSMGRVAYFGDAKHMGAYLSDIGSPPPAGTNLAEFALDLVNKDFTSTSSVVALLDKWSERKGEAFGPPITQNDAKIELVSSRAGLLKQTSTLTRRMVQVAKREPLAYLVRMFANFNVVTFFSIVYLETRDRNQEQVQSRAFMLMFGLGFPMQLVLVSVYQYYTQWVSLQREVKDGMYHPVASAIASWIVQIPMMFVLALCSLIPMYVILDLHWPSFPLVLCIYALTFWTFEGLAQMVAVAPNPIFGLANYLQLFFTSFLFCGMFVALEDVWWGLRWLCYFLPLMWSLQSYMHALLIDFDGNSGAASCEPMEITPIGTICNTQGFYCDDGNGQASPVCYGSTGGELLNSLGVSFTIYSDEGHYVRNMLIVLAFGIFCRLNFIAATVFLTKFTGSEEPGKPSAKAPIEMTAKAEATEAVDDEKEKDAKIDVAAPVEANDPVAFAFQKISYIVTPKSPLVALGCTKPKPPVQILKNISATVRDKEVLAIVGPSGAGKTILLNTLTFDKGPGTPSGVITLNGVTLTRSSFAENCIYVPREDNLWATLTPRQHLTDAFAMYRPEMSHVEREDAITATLVSTGLISAQHTRAGGLLFQGLSGGQRRRLSLAIALVKQPRVIILDEPTSGLDSAAAAAIVKLLKDTAQRCSTAIVCTIHQPSAAVFEGFDSVLVLSEGRVAFCGKRELLPVHYEQIGKKLPDGANPAEAVLDLVSKDISSKDDVMSVLDSWDKLGTLQLGATNLPAPDTLVKKSKSGGCVTTPLQVLMRQARIAINDPLQYLARIFMAPFMVAFFGLVYMESAQASQEQAVFRLFYLWWVLAVPPMLNVVNIILMNLEIRSVIAEMKSGMYSPITYAMSTTLVQLPAMLIFSISVNIVAFAIGGWPWDNFGSYILAYAVNLFVFDSLGQLFAAQFKNPILGMLCYIMNWSSSIVFCGLVFRGDDVIWPFRLFYYVLPLRWLFNALTYDIYMPETYNGAELCNPGNEIPGGNGTVCQSVGYFCPDMPSDVSIGCWGREGSQVLSTLHLTYESLSQNGDDNRPLDFGILIGMGLIIKFMFVLKLVQEVRASAAPVAPA